MREKPFGSSSASYEELSRSLSVSFQEDEMYTQFFLLVRITCERRIIFWSVVDPSPRYRIDHFLAKEVVQNLLTLKFGNSIFNPIWNRNFISSVHVTFKEDIGTDGRGG